MNEEEIKIKEEEIKEEEKEKSLFFKIARIVVALLLLFSFIYFSGFREYFFFSKTSPDEEINSIQGEEVEELDLPVDIFIINGPIYGTNRSMESVNSLIENTSKILNQAGINLEVEEVQERNLNEDEIELILNGDFNLLEYDNRKFNLILMRRLDGLNGVAYPNQGVTMIADYTTGKDYRTLAHEIGHLLGLGHTEKHNYVMTQGKNGRLFSEEEIKKMRQKSNEKFSKKIQ